MGTPSKASFNILDNPFVLLGVEPSASNREVLDALDDAVVDDPSLEAELTNAKQTLLNPKLRTEAELSTLIDTPVGESRSIIARLRSDLGKSDLRQVASRLAPVSCCNLLAHLSAQLAPDADTLVAFVDAKAKVVTEDVISTLDRVRKLAGIIKPDPVIVRDGLYRLSERQAHAIFDGYRETTAAASDATACAARVLLQPDVARTDALEALLRSYRRRVEADLSRRRREIETASEILRHDSLNTDALNRLAQALREWVSFGQPLQLLEAHKGRDEPEARSIYDAVRSLSIDLANHHDRFDVALAITRASAKAFPDLPRAASQITEDLRTLQERVAASGAEPLLKFINDLDDRLKSLAADLRASGFAATSRGLSGSLFVSFSSSVSKTKATTAADLPWALLRNLAIRLNNEANEPAAALALIEGVLLFSTHELPTDEVLQKLRDDRVAAERHVLQIDLMEHIKSNHNNQALAVISKLLPTASESDERNFLHDIRNKIESKRNRSYARWAVFGVIGLVVIFSVLSENKPRYSPPESAPQPTYPTPEPAPQPTYPTPEPARRPPAPSPEQPITPPSLPDTAEVMRANWEEAARQVEGRPDAEEQSVALITIHASKGLEWPIVIPINMTGAPKAESGLMHDRRSDRFSIPVFGVEPADYADIKAWNVAELARDRVRLWYVAATRARDLLILPRHSCVLKGGAYANIVDFDLASLAAIDPEALGNPMPTPTAPPENQQTRDRFAEEASDIARSHGKIEWRQPSRSEAAAPVEAERQPIFHSAELVEETVEQPAAAVGWGAPRGTILHKLMEEVLSGETEDRVDALGARALELMAQLSIAPSDRAIDGISPSELDETIMRTLSIPEIAGLRPRLVPEHTIYRSQANDDGEIIVSGIADAVAYDAEGRIEIIVDWKSDVEIDAERLNCYRGQLEAYQQANRRTKCFLGADDAGNCNCRLARRLVSAVKSVMIFIAAREHLNSGCGPNRVGQRATGNVRGGIIPVDRGLCLLEPLQLIALDAKHQGAEAGEKPFAAGQHNDLHSRCGARHDVEHALNTIIVREDERVVEYHRCRPPLIEQKFGECEARQHGDLLLGSVAEP